MAALVYGGLNVHNWVTTFKEKKPSCTQKHEVSEKEDPGILLALTFPHLCVNGALSAHICLSRQLDGSIDGADAGRTLTAFR